MSRRDHVPKKLKDKKPRNQDVKKLQNLAFNRNVFPGGPAFSVQISMQNSFCEMPMSISTAQARTKCRVGKR